MKDSTPYSYKSSNSKVGTFTGKLVDVLDPNPDDICIEDIAHALSLQCRFGGHTYYHYSVAQHSILCMWQVDDEHKLAALLHDASEAYLVDVPRPIKQRLTNYKGIEDNLMQVIAKKFSFQYPLSIPVKEADEYILQAEWDTLLTGLKPHPLICSRSPSNIEMSFLKAFEYATAIINKTGDRTAA